MIRPGKPGLSYIYRHLTFPWHSKPNLSWHYFISFLPNQGWREMRATNMNKGLRWWVLIIALINPVFYYLARTIGLINKDIAAAATQYNSYFMPAGYVFSIWGVIYMAFLAYAIYQLLPLQRRQSLYDRLSRPFIAANLAGMLWQVVFVQELLSIGTLIITAILLLSVSMFTRVKAALSTEEYNSLLTIPFSLYFGWLTVAYISNASVWLLSEGWYGSPLARQHWTVAIIFAVAALALFISLRYKDWIYPLVVLWAYLGLYVNNIYEHYRIAASAMAAAIALAIFIVSYLIWQYLHDNHHAHHKLLKKHNKHILKH